jgi:cation diffusion facilitator family transporter
MVFGLLRGRASDNCGESIPEEQRSELASRTMILSMVVTVIIGFAELIFSLFSHNKLFLIEGAGNLAWLVPDVMMLLTLRVGAKKADWKMNYGYRRIETLFLLFFALGIALGMVHIIYRTITLPPEQLPTGYGMATVIFSLILIVVLAVLCRVIWSAGKKISSRLLLMDAMIIRLDIASAGILLISGLFLIFAPSVTAIQTILTILVGMGLLVYSLNEAVQAAKELIDASPSMQVMALIEQIAEETPEVLFVSEQRIRSFGGAISLDITIETAPDLTVSEAYRIASGLEDRIRSQVEDIIEIRARVHPAGTFVAEATEEWYREQ